MPFCLWILKGILFRNVQLVAKGFFILSWRAISPNAEVDVGARSGGVISSSHTLYLTDAAVVSNSLSSIASSSPASHNIQHRASRSLQ